MSQVTGCVGHHIGKKEIIALQDPLVFSMSNIRDVVDRLVSGFLFGSIHSPECAKREKVVCGVNIWSSTVAHFWCFRHPFEPVCYTPHDDARPGVIDFYFLS